MNHDIPPGIAQREGEPLDAAALTRDLVREFNEADLHSLDYNVVRERDRTILRITPVEKPWGPNYLRFGLNLASDFRSDATFNVRVLLRKTWMNSLGGEWLLGSQIGSEQAGWTEFYQPLDKRHATFVRPYANTSLSKAPLFYGGDRLAVYRIQQSAAGRGRRQPRRARAGPCGVGRAAHRRGARHRPDRCSTHRAPRRATAALAIDTTTSTFAPRAAEARPHALEALRVTRGRAQVLAQRGALGAAYSLATGWCWAGRGGWRSRARCRWAMPSLSAARAGSRASRLARCAAATTASGGWRGSTA